MVSIPYLNQLPFHIGVESLIGALLPVAGDVIGFFLGLYVVLLCMQFGLSATFLWKMLTNVIIDAVVGIIPIVGDLIDAAFASNLKNLSLLEDHLLANPPPVSTLSGNGASSTSTHLAVKIPPSGNFWPKANAPDISAFAAGQQPSGRSSYWSAFLGSANDTGSGTTKGWKLGGAKKSDIQQVGGWSGDAAHMLWRWIIAIFAKIAGRTQQAAKGAADKRKKAF